MTDLSDATLDAASDRGKYMMVKELITFVERYDDAVERGVPMERLEAYVDELYERGVHAFDREEFRDLVEADLTDSEEWAGPDAIYEVEGGISAFPENWHEALAAEDDVMEYVDFLAAASTEHEGDTAIGGAGTGIPEPLLLDVASALGPFHRDQVRAEVEQLRDEGLVEELADQHPNDRVWPTHMANSEE